MPTYSVEGRVQFEVFGHLEDWTRNEMRNGRDHLVDPHQQLARGRW